ncbi:MAG TPA: CoA transferase [Variovorax sp.]|nr:CoA transferase [Variovorax sp.]
MSALHNVDFASSASGPLQGLRVIDLSRLVAGNMLTLQLADFGADVVKIEPPAGDSLRNFKTDGLDIWWKTYCRNKRSICLDLRRPQARDLVRQLAATADVLVESFKPGVLESMGLAPEHLLEANPKLVVVRLSGWGQTGPYRHKPGFGTLVEGYSGFAAINGFEDRAPVLPPIFLGDMTAGLYGASATMMALWSARTGEGRGQVIDLSLFEPMLSILGPQAANFRFTGKLKPRTGSRSSTTAPRNAYLTSDEHWVCLSTASPAMAARLFSAIGRPDMMDDPRFSTNVARLAHIEEVDRVVGGFVAARTLANNLAFFDREGITIGPINDASQLLDDAYVVERDAIVNVPDEELGHLPMHNVLPRLSRTPGNLYQPAPRRGQHNRDILSTLLTDERFADLVRSGVIVEEGPPATPTAADSE